MDRAGEKIDIFSVMISNKTELIKKAVNHLHNTKTMIHVAGIYIGMVLNNFLETEGYGKNKRTLFYLPGNYTLKKTLE